MKASEVLEQINNETVISIMEENGSPLYKRTIDGRTRQECLWFKTICHGGDSHKLCYFSDTHDFFCYTCCGKLTFWDLIKKIRNISDNHFYEAVKYVAEKLGIWQDSLFTFGAIRDEESLKLINKSIELMKRKMELSEDVVPDEYVNKIYDDTILRYFDNNTFYNGWIDEGITVPTMRKYGISWYACMNHIIIPHYDIDNNLIGIRRRSLNPEDAHNKYMPEYISGFSYEHSLGLNLYGINKAKDAIKKFGAAVVVEGEKSVLLSDSYFGEDSYTVATCGFNISNIQLELLKKAGADTIYIGFDKDFDLTKEVEYKKNEEVYDNFVRYRNRLYSLARRVNAKGFKVYLIVDKYNLLGKKDSPFDKGKDVFEKLLSKSILYSS